MRLNSALFLFDAFPIRRCFNSALIRCVLIRRFFYSFGCSEQGGGHVAQGEGKGVGLCGLECCGLAVNDVAMEALGQPLGGAAEVFARDFAEVDEAAYFEACKPCGIGF